MRDVRVASVQMESAAGDKEANFAKLERFAREAAGRERRDRRVPRVLPHRLLVPAAPHRAPARAAGRAASPTARAARGSSPCPRSHGLSLGAGLVESAGEGVFHNTYVVAMPDGRLVRHRKLHAFEHPAIQPGDEHTVFDTPHGFRAALLICYDNNIVENVRIAALRGAEVLLAPHQTGGCRTTNPHLMGVIDRRLWDERESNPEAIERELRGEKGRAWLMRWLPSRAHDNGLFLVFSNGVGVDDDEIRTGNATIFDPYGRILAETLEGRGRHGRRGSRRLAPREGHRAPLDAGAPTRPSTASSRVPTGRERDAHQLKFEE